MSGALSTPCRIAPRGGGVGGDEAIHGLVDMMNVCATIDAYMRAVPIHPTASELIPTLLGEMTPAAPGP
jgi:hypothetical protein